MDFLKLAAILAPQLVPWLTSAYVVLAVMRRLDVAALLSDLLQPFLARRWIKQLRDLEVPDDQIGKFIRDFATHGRCLDK